MTRYAPGQINIPRKVYSIDAEPCEATVGYHVNSQSLFRCECLITQLTSKRAFTSVTHTMEAQTERVREHLSANVTGLCQEMFLVVNFQ